MAMIYAYCQVEKANEFVCFLRQENKRRSKRVTTTTIGVLRKAELAHHPSKKAEPAHHPHHNQRKEPVHHQVLEELNQTLKGTFLTAGHCSSTIILGKNMMDWTFPRKN
uniref:Uncharacterized protein n=1 Tax=Micrurus spixii TaxID=129469 RepID=A0A2D4N0P7_9SAUR